MPEGFTYYDMARMLKATIPIGLYRLEHNDIFTQVKDIAGRTGKEKAKARKTHPDDFFPDLDKTFPNHQQLPEDIWSGRTQFPFSSESIESYGKALGLRITSVHWLRVFGSLHGHILPMTREEYNGYKIKWEQDPRAAPYILLAILGEQYCVAVVDREKLSTITTITISDRVPVWFKPGTGPCPIRSPEDFKRNLLQGRAAAGLRDSKKSIYEEMTSADNIFNGIGTSHACEILHLARIHPQHRASHIFNNYSLQIKLQEATATFFAQATSLEYTQQVPAKKTTDPAFEFSRAVTRYINEQFTRVYQKRSVWIPLDHYQELLQSQLIDPVPGSGIQYKKVLVNCFHTGRVYYYSILNKPAPGAGLLTAKLVPRQDWKGRALNALGNTAEIGIASFMDTVVYQKEQATEVPKTSRRVSIKTGQRGRPIKRKWRNTDTHIIKAREEKEKKGKVKEKEQEDSGSEEEADMGFEDILRDEQRETIHSTPEQVRNEEQEDEEKEEEEDM
ncbi:MAG: hypothetical protein M1837_000963 [Sclerophora amabilis]|nr:MAG: hypothetical protein M1837_000963 [Sclerophora amabilis]